MKTLILSVAFGFMFFSFASIMDFNEGAYSKDLHVSNVAYCEQALEDHEADNTPISGELLSLCKNEL